MIDSDFDEPILFRTTSADVYKSTLETGSLWLRSDCYYREIEDEARRDNSEGISSAKITVPLRFHPKNGYPLEITGTGSIGQQIRSHYILSLHGSSISEAQLSAFGGHIFGIKSISKLSAEILYRSSLVLKCDGYRFGAVYYRHATLALSHHQQGSAAMCLGGSPSVYLNPLDTDVLRKDPVTPFIEQDEWRIAIFTNGYLEGDSSIPLPINVDPLHFYPYSARSAQRKPRATRD